MTTRRGVLREVAELERMTRAELQARWRELFDSEPPPAYRRETLFRRLAYRVQELAHGGLSDATRAKLRAHVASEASAGQVPTTPLKRRGRDDDTPVPGTRLVREWRGERFEVTVLDDGFELRGQRFRSLSAIARHITGSRWNGKLFFGLRKQRRSSGN